MMKSSRAGDQAGGDGDAVNALDRAAAGEDLHAGPSGRDDVRFGSAVIRPQGGRRRRNPATPAAPRSQGYTEES